MPKSVASLKLKKDDVKTPSSRGILAIKWTTKMTFIWLAQRILPLNKNGKENKGDGKGDVIKLACVLEYNQEMGGVGK